MRTGSAPAWAVDLALRVCAEAFAAPPDVLRWRRASRELSTGLTRRHARSIAITAGLDPDDARHTLLHELAHWLTPDPPRRLRGRRRAAIHHGRAFYLTALALFDAYDPEPLAALRRESVRYPSVLAHASALGVPGVELLVAERRQQRRSRGATRGAWRILVPEHPVRLTREGRWYVCRTCGRRLIGRSLLRAARRGGRERHTLWTRENAEAAG